MAIPFWYNHPLILFDKKGLLQFWPLPKMTPEEKCNAITRLVIVLTLGGFCITQKPTLLIIGAITLAIIVITYLSMKKKYINSLIKKEGFDSNNTVKRTISEVGESGGAASRKNLPAKFMNDQFQPTTQKNPFGNVLPTDIMDNPDRKSARPAFDYEVSQNIDSAVKKQIQNLNPTIKNTNEQLFGTLKGDYDLDKSLMRFNSNANTRVSNDQDAYAKFLYGDMHSSKQSDAEGAAMRVKNNMRYTQN